MMKIFRRSGVGEPVLIQPTKQELEARSIARKNFEEEMKRVRAESKYKQAMSALSAREVICR